MHWRRRKPYSRGARKQNPETTLQNRVRIDLSDNGILNYRNNTGVLKDRYGRAVTYGLCPGSSDLIAVTPVVITEEMVGKTIGVFTAIEVKMPGKYLKSRQRVFMRHIWLMGGFIAIAKSVDGATKMIRRAVERLKK